MGCCRGRVWDILNYIVITNFRLLLAHRFLGLGHGIWYWGWLMGQGDYVAIHAFRPDISILITKNNLSNHRYGNLLTTALL